MFKLGQEVKYIPTGEIGIITQIRDSGSYPITVANAHNSVERTFTLGGKEYKDHIAPDIERVDGEPWEYTKVHKDKVVLVSKTKLLQIPLEDVREVSPRRIILRNKDVIILQEDVCKGIREVILNTEDLI